MNYSPPEKQLIYLIRFWVLAFSITEGIFLFFRDPFFNLINNLSLKITPALLPLPLPQERFFLVLTTSLMVTLVFMCLWAQSNLKKNYILVPAILVSKFTSTLFFFLFFILYQKSLAYMVGVLSDGFVFLVTYSLYARAKPYIISEAQ